MLVIFDLDNTLVDRARFFHEWALLFADERNLGAAGVEWLHGADQDGLSARVAFFTRTRDHVGLGESVEEMVDGLGLDLTANQHFARVYASDAIGSAAAARRETP